MFRKTSWLALAGLASVLATPCSATGYGVNPVKVILTPAQPSALLTIDNPSDQPLNLQVSTFRWSLDEKGENRLDPTEDILCFPLLFQVSPHAKRNLRIGALVPFDSQEGSYRLLIEELRQPAAGSTTAIQFLTKVSVPVFQATEKPFRDLRIAYAAVLDSRLSFRMENRGNVHIPPHKLSLRGQDASGVEILAREIEDWYLLPGTTRPFGVDLPTEVCQRLKVLEIRGEVEGMPFSHRVQPGPDACAR
jgi:fimbrial chaperone protein